MKLQQNLESLQGVFVIADILITGQGETEGEADEGHDCNLAKFLNHCTKQHLKLKKEKFNYICKEVQFIGHRLTKEGLKPDPQKVEAAIKWRNDETLLVCND